MKISLSGFCPLICSLIIYLQDDTIERRREEKMVWPWASWKDIHHFNLSYVTLWTEGVIQYSILQSASGTADQTHLWFYLHLIYIFRQRCVCACVCLFLLLANTLSFALQIFISFSISFFHVFSSNHTTCCFIICQHWNHFGASPPAAICVYCNMHCTAPKI